MKKKKEEEEKKHHGWDDTDATAATQPCEASDDPQANGYSRQQSRSGRLREDKEGNRDEDGTNNCAALNSKPSVLRRHSIVSETKERKNVNFLHLLLTFWLLLFLFWND